MKKLVKESLSELPSWDELVSTAPEEIQDIIEKCKLVPQSVYWHPEGEVYKHIRIVFDRAVKTGDINMIMASFFHDLGKFSTTAKNTRGQWSAHGHEEISARLAAKYATWIVEKGADSKEVYEIVKGHMKVKLIDEMRPAKQAEMRRNPYFEKINAFSDHDNMKTLTSEEKNRYK